MKPILSPEQAREYARGLRTFDLQELGSQAWLEQHRRIEALSLQVHQEQAFQLRREEGGGAVVEALTAAKKWDVLIRSLIASHLFATRIYPFVVEETVGLMRQQEQKGAAAALLLYNLLHHEVVLAELFAAVLLDDLPPCEHLDDLLDWCRHRLEVLIRGSFNATAGPTIDPRYVGCITSTDIGAGADAGDELRRQLREHESTLSYSASLTCLTLLRGLLSHHLDIGAQHKVRSLRIAPLCAMVLGGLTKQHYGNLYPWQRQKQQQTKTEKANILEYWEDAQWHTYVTAEEAAVRLTKQEAQVWLSLYEIKALIGGDAYDPSEIEVFAGIKGRLNESLMMQYPFLKEYREYLELLVLEGAKGGDGSALAAHQQRIQDEYGFSTSTLPTGVVLVQTANWYESELLESLQFWANSSRSKATDTFITTIESEEVTHGLQVTSFAEVADATKQALYKHVATHFLSRLTNLTIEELSGDIEQYLEQYDRVLPVCAVCNRVAQNRCSRCKEAWYCSRKCQVTDWKRGHKEACGKPQVQTQIQLTTIQDTFDTPD
ncbi:MYND finger domain-containing protein [Giardia muris]|uniref:MYND finger domain-containing protein n=1 Tax=Giardia muris TaxID=5742 RepID=A0A4Z1SM07_GIAMU|nr:MYND finger domain-containing protein [Giardia muris]|eukprot:TNJ26580.1 MYND finger domain-containing protein [Giardia muris]